MDDDQQGLSGNELEVNQWCGTHSERRLTIYFFCYNLQRSDEKISAFIHSVRHPLYRRHD